MNTISIESNENNMALDNKFVQEKSVINLSCEHKHDQVSAWLTNFINIYQSLSTDNLAIIESIYDENICFTDPIHRIEGLSNLKNYFDNLYTNLSSCTFHIQHFINKDQEATVFWSMTYQHPKLNKGNEVTVEGCSHLKAANGKIIYHRDFLDLGSMLYEQIPVLGRAIKWIKQKAGK